MVFLAPALLLPANHALPAGLAMSQVLASVDVAFGHKRNTSPPFPKLMPDTTDECAASRVLPVALAFLSSTKKSPAARPTAGRSTLAVAVPAPTTVNNERLQ